MDSWLTLVSRDLRWFLIGERGFNSFIRRLYDHHIIISKYVIQEHKYPNSAKKISVEFKLHELRGPIQVTIRK